MADAGQGVIGLGATSELVAELPGVADAIHSGDGDILAVTGEPPEMTGPSVEGSRTLYRISGDNTDPVADLWAFEQAENPDQAIPEIGSENVESNPFDLARLESSTLVADAAGNDLLMVGDDGSVDWMTVFPAQMASTGYLTDLVDCENPPEEAAFVCELPPQLPAQPVPTSVAIGPDGNYYVGELTGFPATPGLSRIWRVEPGTTNVVCPGDGCTQVFTGTPFSAVIDVSFGPDGTFYVLEIDESGFLAAELGLGTGGTLNACRLDDEVCVQLATGLFLSTASTVGDHGTIYATTGALVPDAAGVIALGKEFGDDNGSVHELNIALLAASEITAGCNPPDNDSFCPDGETTRGEMAAFLVRALDLPASDEDIFTDDEGSVFEGNINALAAAGVTKGCNPPENDEFCPDRSVSRAEMAAFLVRGLSLAASADDAFTDDDGSIFESDINSLAAAGITKGCNPPVNDNYCPDGATTRGEMASFLVRALKLGS